MNYGTNILIAWHMFLDWLKNVFGGGVMFPTGAVTNHTAPGYQAGYSK